MFFRGDPSGCMYALKKVFHVRTAHRVLRTLRKNVCLHNLKDTFLLGNSKERIRSTERDETTRPVPWSAWRLNLGGEHRKVGLFPNAEACL